jgi:hypothetical protein
MNAAQAPGEIAKPVMKVLAATDDHLQGLMHYGHSHDLREAMATVQELVEALEPFAQWASGFGPHGREDSWVIARTPAGKTLTMGDVRRAHSVIAKAGGAA